MKNVFKVGDIVKGKINNGYGVTNERMLRAEVKSLHDGVMNIKVLNHENSRWVGSVFNVSNTGKWFELVENVINIKLDDELELERLQKKIEKSKTNLGVKICEDEVHRLDVINQTSNIANCSPFKTFKERKRSGKETVVYYLKGNEITCVYQVDNEKPYKGSSKCSPEDEFDFSIGVRIAEARAKIARQQAIIKKYSNEIK